MLPDWAPNVHPLIVHFPIALLIAAALVDVVSLGIRRQYPTVRHAAVGLYALGALAAIGTFFTGRSAADGVDLPTTAITAVNAHSDWALWTVWVFGLYAVLRLGVTYWKRSGDLVVHLPLALVGVAALFLVQQTAERGAKLVYLYGVGVQAVDIENPTRHDHDAHGMTIDNAESMNHMEAVVAITPTADGAWAWTATDGRLPSGLQFLEGDEAALDATSADDTVVLRPQRPVLFVLGKPLGDVQAEATLDLAGFTGIVMLVHHVHTLQDYDFLAVDKPASGPAMIRQGRVEGGMTTVFAEKTTALVEPVELRAVAAGGHFRGLLAGTLLTHGHGDAADAGRVGLRIAGSGPVGVLRFAATPVQ